MAALAECMETIGGVPKTLLDRPHGVLEGRHGRRGLVIPRLDESVRFVTHYGTRPDFCEGPRFPSSKVWVE